jgi:hypothetical protein
MLIQAREEWRLLEQPQLLVHRVAIPPSRP